MRWLGYISAAAAGVFIGFALMGGFIFYVTQVL